MIRLLIFSQFLDAITYLAIGRAYEGNPLVREVGVEATIIGKVLLLLLAIGVAVLFVRLDRYRRMERFVLALGIAAGVVGAGTNVAVLL